jgi:hypothetical protein
VSDRIPPEAVPPEVVPPEAAPVEAVPPEAARAEVLSPPRPPRVRSAYTRILVAAGVALLAWQLVPHVPHDQTVIFALGKGSAQVAQLEVLWKAEGQLAEGRLVLNFPSSAPERVVRQFRLANGEYEFRVAARLRSERVEQTEVTRRVTLEGNAVTLRLEELTQ